MIVAAVFVANLSGCEDKRRHAAGESGKFGSGHSPLAPDASPEAVALATLDALRQAQLSRARGLGSEKAREDYASAMRTLQSLAATADIFEKVRSTSSMSIPKDVTEEGALTLTLESWVSTVAHYVEGYDLTSLSPSTLAPDSYVNIYVRAENPHDRQVVEQLREGATTSGPSDSLIRDAALKEGINPPPGAGIDLSLKKVNGSWRVLKVTIGPARPGLPAHPPASTPTTAPAA